MNLAYKKGNGLKMCAIDIGFEKHHYIVCNLQTHRYLTMCCGVYDWVWMPLYVLIHVLQQSLRNVC